MRAYSGVISLNLNSRGVYCLDTTKGCSSGMKQKGGCYGDCYAAKAAKIHGFDFSKTVLRNFINEKHRREILNQINNVKLDFIRIGCSGDPSENWEHTLKILNQIRYCNKEIVIITRHWTTLTDEQLIEVSGFNVCINTSVSALDNHEIMQRCLEQYHRIKPYCKSILRIVSCQFNLENETGKRLSEIQHDLFKNETTLDTVFRVSKSNQFVKDGVIIVKESKFLGKKSLISKFNKKTYLGKCSTCVEMCGARMKTDYKGKRKIATQLTFANELKSSQINHV